MNKPLCKVTLQDLLDSIQASEKAGKPIHLRSTPEKESLNDWLSLEEIAENLNINPDLLYACMHESEQVGVIQSGASIFRNQLYVKH